MVHAGALFARLSLLRRTIFNLRTMCNCDIAYGYVRSGPYFTCASRCPAAEPGRRGLAAKRRLLTKAARCD
jgi:hypothetical protein